MTQISTLLLKRLRILLEEGLWRSFLPIVSPFECRTPRISLTILADGAILFRGFPVKNATDFQKFVRAFKFPQPHREVGLAGKRTTVTTDVKTANEEPPDVKFYYHSEYGRTAHFPGILFFFSEIVPGQGLLPPRTISC